MTYSPNPQGWGHYPNPDPYPAEPTQAGWLPPLPPQPAPGWAQPQPGYPAYPPPPGYPGWPPAPGPAQRNRKPLIITLSVIAAVVLVVIVVVAVASFSDSGSGKAGDAVKGYLDALARGDASAALEYSSDEPGSKEFLTDALLKKQIARWPISGVKILSDSSERSFGYAQVHVVAKFGDNTSDVTMSVKKSGKAWKLEHAAIKVEPLGTTVNDSLKTLRFFGTAVGTAPVYIFPGFVEATSSNLNVAVKQRKPYLLDALSAAGGYFNDFEFTLSESGQSAIMSAISAALEDCTRSNQLSPRGCPQHARDPDIVDGTVSWGTPDLSGLKLSIFNEYHLDARYSGDVKFPLSAKTKTGDSKIGIVRAYLSAQADVSQSPPKVSIQ